MEKFGSTKAADFTWCAAGWQDVFAQEFGQKEFRNCHYFNFEEDERISQIFEKDLKPQRIIDELRFYRNSNIDPGQDIVIFDEIQRCGRALTSLNIFTKKCPIVQCAPQGRFLG